MELTQEMIKAGGYLVLDTETTGLDGRAEICQIAIVDSRGKTLLDTLVKPSSHIPESASRIHGITDMDVKSAPTWYDIQGEVLGIIKDKAVIVYNADFDKRMLMQSSKAVKSALVPEWILWDECAYWLCAMKAFAFIYGDYNNYHGNYKWQPLAVAASYYGIEQRKAHTALDDCLTTLAVVQAMARPTYYDGIDPYIKTGYIDALDSPEGANE